MLRTLRFTVALAALVQAGCGSDTARTGSSPHADSVRTAAASTPADPVRDTWYRATVLLPGGPASFGLILRENGNTSEVVLVNGPERIRVRQVEIDGNRYTMRLPAFNSTLSARRQGDTFEGTLTLVKRGGNEQVMPFHAVPLEAPNESAKQPGVHVTGRWAVAFIDDAGDTSRAVAEFVQRGDSLAGTFLTPTGDYRYLAGTVEDRSFSLSCFDGAHAFLFTASVTETDSILGEFWSGTSWHERWVAVRDITASLPDAASLTTLREGTNRFEFSFPDVDGRIVTQDDERFRGHVTVITLAGSWCPNCHDEAAFLARLYDRLHDDGLEAVGLMYEHYRDFARAARQVRRFAGKHRIHYPLLVAGYSDKKEAAATLPSLDRIVAFPTIIVLDRAGTVRRIHTGFSGPATGAHYVEFTREFTSFVTNLLAEPPPRNGERVTKEVR